MHTRRTIWIDLDNTPHVPFFRPIIRELQARGHGVTVTARDAFQVCELADLFGVRYTTIGRHYGKHPIRKIAGLLWRSLQMLPFVSRERPDIAVSHGSRSQILLCNLLGIPTVMAMDYEYARMPFLLRPKWEVVPSALAGADLQCQARERILVYDGIKEDVYAPEFRPDDDAARRIGLDPRRIVVTVRPPASDAHYHSPESDVLFAEFMDFARGSGDVQVVLLPRNKSQESRLRAEWPEWFDSGFLLVPSKAVDGLTLLWFSDLVVSGGGTMNREAAALHLPVYSIFRGPIGMIDRQLQRDGRLILIETVADVRQKILLRRRDRTSDSVERRPSTALSTILDHIDLIIDRECAADGPGGRHRGVLSGNRGAQ